MKGWSKAKVEVVMVHSGPEGVPRAVITVFLSMVLRHSLPPRVGPDCPCYKGSRVPVPEDTPLLELINISAQA